MDQSILQHIENLRTAILSLKATGNSGFEGLMGAALHEISGVPFRLAGSGSQFGVDGEPVYENDAICFEAKRYRGRVPKDKVLYKIADLAISGKGIDTWILGATSRIMSQIAGDARKLGTEHGIFVLILDWSETDLPPLAVALAMGGTRVKDFLERNLGGEKLSKAVQALEIIRGSPDFTTHADRIKIECNDSAMGLALAQKANTAWLMDAFSNRQRAKAKFGQSLSPGDAQAGRVLERKPLVEKLGPFLTAGSGENVTIVLGDEGSGKSWLVAQTWLNLEPKPLTIFMGPDDFEEKVGRNDFGGILASKITEQTGGDTRRERWSTRLDKWKKYPETNHPRIIVVIDGINQRPKTDWARIVAGLSHELGQLGGRLIITTRTHYFRNRVQGRLSAPLTEILVPEWREEERDEILAGAGIRANNLHQDVANSLRNPRLLAIALELLKTAEITNLHELSATRLLFEHIRVGEKESLDPQPAPEFARKLQKHAQQIMSRWESGQLDDLKIFESEMGAVADGRFFQQVEDDPTRYYLKDAGLTLALGFAVIDRLCAAQRNSRGLDSELQTLLEPITALDDTADVILAALTIASLDNRYRQDISASLVTGFASLQNPDQSKFPSFAGLAKSRPEGFMNAARALSLAKGYQSNFDWVRGALLSAAQEDHVWQEMASEVHEWLSMYSLSPERGIFSQMKQDPGVAQEKREKNQQRIDEKLRLLSVNEQKIRERLRQEEGDLDRLVHLALMLLAGKHLSPFARSLFSWSFSHALNPDFNSPYDDFISLVRLNRTDWQQTRSALLELMSTLRQPEVSNTGKWALVTLLRSTGNSDDGKEASSLMRELNKDMQGLGGWRLVEKYCATDPCDPSSEKPENIMKTAEDYGGIDVSTLVAGRNPGDKYLFFEIARPGIARFVPKVAVAKHIEFARDVISRKGNALRFALFELRKHQSLLTNSEAFGLVEKSREVKSMAAAENLTEKTVWIMSQYCLLLAFPLLDAAKQAEALLSSETDENILLELFDSAKYLTAKEFESLLESACNENNEGKQFLLLGIAKSINVPLSENSRACISALSESKSKRIRAFAFGFIAQSGDEKLLRQIAASDWKAGDDEPKDYFEFWFGSLALLEAAKRGWMPHDEALNRISERIYGPAARMLNSDVVHEIALRIDTAIHNAVGLDANTIAPEIEFQANPISPLELGWFSLSEKPPGPKDISKEVGHFQESDAEFELRHEQYHEKFLQFKTTLTEAKARIILDYITPEEFVAIVHAAGELAIHWYELFMNIPDSKLPAVHNLILLLAHALMPNNQEKARELFLRVKDSEPLMKLTYGKAGIQLDQMAIWAGIRNPVSDELRFERLDHAVNDHELFVEVLAALSNGKHELLSEYIESKLCREEPAEIARGIMVAGFSDCSESNCKVLKRYEGSAGLIGHALEAAKYAYERNVWARHWYDKMCGTEDNIQFWCHSVQFSKIVDARFEVWGTSFEEKGNSARLFSPSVEYTLRDRYKRCEHRRRKKLFGADAPAPIFIKVVAFT